MLWVRAAMVTAASTPERMFALAIASDVPVRLFDSMLVSPQRRPGPRLEAASLTWKMGEVACIDKYAVRIVDKRLFSMFRRPH